MPDAKNSKYRIGLKELASIFDYLKSNNYQNVGPMERDGAIMLDQIEDFESIPRGRYEEIGKGKYRVISKQDDSLFNYTVGPQSFKRFLHPPKRKLFRAERTTKGFSIDENVPRAPQIAFWGIRSCELLGLEILDRIFLKGEYVNKWYQQARADLFIVAAGCTIPSPNCFCTTSGSGPKPEKNYDLSLIEVATSKDHYFICEAGSEAGTKVINSLKLKQAKEDEIGVADKLMDKASKSMNKRFDQQEVAELLKASPEHRHWDEIAQRCLSCANCTMVCPTCFCTSTEDITDITGDHTDRWMRWDSCFNGDYSYIHGAQIRSSTNSRFRHWMTHKLSSWYVQFGTSGCVGCGRCITWCPVGIDISEEVETFKT